MKKFLDHVFKPYIFPIVILIIGVYLKTGENLKSVTSFFSNSTNSFIKFFSNQFYLWEVILYLLVVFLVLKTYRLIFKKKSKKERAMLHAIKKVPHDFPVTIIGTADKYIFKFDPIVEGDAYQIYNLRPYCLNCSPKPIRMTEVRFGDFRCNCGKEIDFSVCQDVKSRIITVLEENER